MYPYRRNSDETARKLERAYIGGDYSVRDQLVAALARTNNFKRIFEILPKINPLMLDRRSRIPSDLLPCGCNYPIEAIELPVTQGYGALGACKCDQFHAFLMNAHSIIEAYEAGHRRMYSFKPSHDPAGYYIGGNQYYASAVTIGPVHTSYLKVLPNGWLELYLWFDQNMVSQDDFISPPNEHGRVQVLAQIDPDNIDWWVNTRAFLKFPPDPVSFPASPALAKRKNPDEDIRQLERQVAQDPGDRELFEYVNHVKKRRGQAPLVPTPEIIVSTSQDIDDYYRSRNWDKQKAYYIKNRWVHSVCFSEASKYIDSPWRGYSIDRTLNFFPNKQKCSICNQDSGIDKLYELENTATEYLARSLKQALDDAHIKDYTIYVDEEVDIDKTSPSFQELDPVTRWGELVESFYYGEYGLERPNSIGDANSFYDGAGSPLILNTSPIDKIVRTANRAIIGMALHHWASWENTFGWKVTDHFQSELNVLFFYPAHAVRDDTISGYLEVLAQNL